MPDSLPFKKKFPVKLYLLLLLAIFLPILSAAGLFFLKVKLIWLLTGTISALIISLVLSWFMLKKLTYPFQYLNQLAMDMAMGEIKNQLDSGERNTLLPFLISALQEPGGELNLLNASQNQKINQKLEEILQFRMEELFEISSLSEKILSDMEIASFGRAMMEMLQKLAEPEWAAFYLFREPDGFILINQTGLSEKEKANTNIIVIPGEKDPLYPLVYLHQAVKMENPSSNLFLKERLPLENLQQYYAVPILYQKKLLGLIELAWDREKLDSIMEKILQALSRQAGIILENIILYKSILKESRTLREVMNYTSAGIMKLDQKLKISFFNQAAQNITGFPADQVLGKFCHEVFHGKNYEGLPVCSPNECNLFKDNPQGDSNPSKFLTYDNHNASRQVPYAEYELCFDQPIGEKKILKFIAYKMNDGFLLTFFDITRLRESAQIYESFFPLIFNQMISDFEQIKQKLNNTINYNLLAPQENLESLKALQDENADLLLKFLEALQIARLKGGGLTNTLQPIYLEKITEKMVSLINEFYPERKFKIFSEISSKIYGDPNAVNYAIFKLIKNALFFSPPKSPINIQLKEDNREITFSVEDSGPDLNQPQRKNLADLLETQNLPQESYSRVEDLSFYLVNNLIKAQKGKLMAHNLAGKGVSFSFTLPKKFND